MKENSRPFWILFGVAALLITIDAVRLADSALPTAAAQSSGHPVHVIGVQLPASLAYATVNEGGDTHSNLNVDSIIISNTDASNAHTVNVVDCSSTPFTLFNGAAIAAGTVWSVPLYGTRFNGCMKWTASSTTVMGALTGSR